MVTKTETVITTAAAKPFAELSPHHQLLVAAMEPDDEAMAGWQAKREKGAADSDLAAFIKFILQEMHGHPHHCSNEAGVIWWAIDEGGCRIWFGADDPLADKRLSDLSYAALIREVRGLYDIPKPKPGAGRKKKATKKKPAADALLDKQLARVAKHTAGGGQSVESADVPIESILVVQNEREDFDQKELKTLAADIKARGIDSPLLVVPHEFTSDLCQMGEGYRLIAGERRLRAAKLAGLTVVPVRIRHGLAESDVAVVRLQENLQRVNLNPIEKARGVKRLISQHNMKQKDVAKLLGCSQGQVANIIRMLKLPPAIAEAMAAGKLSATVARDSLPMWEALSERANDVAEAAVNLMNLNWEAPYTSQDVEESAVDAVLAEDDCRRLDHQCPFSMTPKRRKLLDVVQVTDWCSVTFNVDEYDKLAAASKKNEKKTGTKPKASPAEAKANAEAAGLSPAEIAKVEREAVKQKAAEAREVLAKRLAVYGTSWLQQQVMAAAAEGMTPAQGLRLLLHFAAEQRGNARSVGNAHLADCVKKAGGRGVKCDNSWPVGIKPLPSLLSIADKDVATVATQWLQTAMAADPEAFGSSWRPAAVRAAAVMFGVSLDAWRVDEQFLKLHTIDQLLKLQKEWKLSGTWTAVPTKAKLVEWLLSMDSGKKPLAAPKALAKAVK